MVENKKHLKERINACFIDFSKNGRRSKFWCKKCSGNLLGFEELQIGGDVRILMRITPDESHAVFEVIGTYS